MGKNAGVPGAGAKMCEDNKRYLEPGDRNWHIGNLESDKRLSANMLTRRKRLGAKAPNLLLDHPDHPDHHADASSKSPQTSDPSSPFSDCEI